MAKVQTSQSLKPRVRRVPLGFMGEEWNDAYAEFRYLTWADTKAIRSEAKQLAEAESDDAYVDATIKTVRDFLVGGMVLNAANELVALTPEMIEAFDLDAIQVLYQRLMGVPDPNVSTPLPTS